MYTYTRIHVYTYVRVRAMQPTRLDSVADVSYWHRSSLRLSSREPMQKTLSFLTFTDLH